MLLTQKLQLILQVCVSLVWLCLLLCYILKLARAGTS